jgi:hypothetical protein
MFARLRPVFSAIASNRRARVWLTLGFAVTALAVMLTGQQAVCFR